MKRSILLIALLLGFASLGRAVEILRWERLPLSVRLVVGQERVIFVDRNVRVGVPAALRGHLRVQSAGGALYLLASAPIDPTRLQLQDAQTGSLILLDIAADDAPPDSAPLEPIRIVDSAALRTSRGEREFVAGASAQGEDTFLASSTPLPVVLTRYAAQSLYAPLRTVEPVPGLVRVAAPRNLALDTLLPTLPVRAKALVAWRLGDHWVTAVRVTNTVQQWLVLDPRALQGTFIVATFQHADLGPAGDSTDTTMLYLITRGHGLADALLPSVGPINPTLNLPPTRIEEGVPREE